MVPKKSVPHFATQSRTVLSGSRQRACQPQHQPVDVPSVRMVRGSASSFATGPDERVDDAEDRCHGQEFTRIGHARHDARGDTAPPRLRGAESGNS
jgi:hypothetical protein